MSVDAGNFAVPQGKPGFFSISRDKLDLGLLWFAMAISSIVLIEPAPFDFMVLILIGTWLLSGLHIPKPLTLPLLLLGILSTTGLFAAFLSETLVGSGRHILITIFLYILTVGLAAFIARNPQRVLPVIMNGYIVAALLATVAGIIGYFTIIDSAHDLFVFRERARGTFKDPNVFGPFLVVPIVYIFMRHLAGEERIGSLQSGLLVVLSLGILLSFSRGAWANLVFSTGIATYLLFVSVRSNSLRLKVLGLTFCLALIGAALLVFALSFDAIADLMSIRGQLIQSYDTDERFAGAAIALDLILNNPLGIGAESFANYHNVEPHNVYMYSFVIGGWIGGFAYICLVLYTIYVGFRCTLREGQLRLLAIVLFSTFLAVALEGLIVDTDHWRHFYILMASIWGLHCYMMKDRAAGREEVGTLQRIRSIPALTERLTAKPRNALLESAVTRTQKTLELLDPETRPSPRKQWRRRLGKTRIGVKIPGTTPSKSVATADTAPVATLQSVAEPVSNQELRDRYRVVPSGEAASIPPLDRSVFGVRSPDSVPEQRAFGRR